MEQYISLQGLKIIEPSGKPVGLVSYKCEDGNWIECKETNGALEPLIRNALQQGAKQLCLLMQDLTTGEQYPLEFDAWDLVRDKYSGMQNKAMARKLRNGQAIDVSGCAKTTEGYYQLDDFFEGKDYCDAKEEAWIWSIGISYETGQVLASTDSVFYQNTDFDCLWLR